MSFGDLGRKPNILIIITDQEREVMHWPAGWAEANLPARSRLLEHGLQFTRAQCNTAACSSSRATFFTGLYPAQHGVKNLVNLASPSDVGQRRTAMLPSSLPNLAKVMTEAGYHVVLKGKLHLTRPVNYDPARKRHDWSDADVAHLAEKYGFHGWNPPDMSDPMSLDDLGGGHINNDGRYVDDAINFLNTYDGDKPFCLIVALVNPHDVQEYPGRGLRGISIDPTYVRGGYRLADFRDLPIGLPANIDDDLSTKPSVHASFRQVLAIGTGHMKTRQRQLNYARFYAYLNMLVDAHIGRVLNALDANGLTNDTVILRTSDHGELGMSHGRMRQKFYNAYRETLSVPLIVSNPLLYPQPQQTDALASLIDVVPTLAHIGGVSEPERFGFKGRDLTPILGNAQRTVQDVLHFTYEDDVFPVKGADCIRAIVERDWKYAVYYDPFTGAQPEFEMYDLQNDRLEMKNLAHASHSTPESEAERARLHQRLNNVMKENGTTPDEIVWPGVNESTTTTTTTINEKRSTDVNSISATKKVLTTAVLLLATLIASPAAAQLNGENLLGDMGVKSGTQPEPGLYTGNVYYRYFTNKIMGPNGEQIVFDPTGSGEQTIQASVPMAIYVSKKKFFGANIGMMAVMPFANGSLEAPGLALTEKASTGASDLYVMPAQLGWHGKRFDAIAGVAFFAPTGRYVAGASDNLGKGMWSYEVSGGTTVYLDKRRSVSVAATAFWETHTAKEGAQTIEHVTVDNVKVGQLLTIEGGFGKSFLHGAAGIGVAYYAQWKLTDDAMTVSSANEVAIRDKHRVYGIGPEVTIPIATKSKLISIVNIRYLWETGAQIKTQGQSLMVTTTFPVGGIKIGR